MIDLSFENFSYFRLKRADGGRQATRRLKTMGTSAVIIGLLLCNLFGMPFGLLAGQEQKGPNVEIIAITGARILTAAVRVTTRAQYSSRTEKFWISGRISTSPGSQGP